MGPVMVVELPHAGVGISPPRFNGLHRKLGGLPVPAVQVIVTGRGREELERLAQRVELELAVDPVTDLVRAARVAGQMGE